MPSFRIRENHVMNLLIGKEDSLTGNIVDSAPENYPPILVQSMMKKVVEENRDRRAIVSCDGKIDWNYGQYYQEVQKAAKGFISLGKDDLGLMEKF